MDFLFTKRETTSFYSWISIPISRVVLLFLVFSPRIRSYTVNVSSCYTDFVSLTSHLLVYLSLSIISLVYTEISGKILRPKWTSSYSCSCLFTVLDRRQKFYERDRRHNSIMNPLFSVLVPLFNLQVTWLTPFYITIEPSAIHVICNLFFTNLKLM